MSGHKGVGGGVEGGQGVTLQNGEWSTDTRL